MKNIRPLLLATILIAACAPDVSTTTPQTVTVYSTSAAEPWLAELYECTAGTPVILSRGADADAAQIVLRLGEPEDLDSPAFQIGVEQLLIVTHRASPVQELNLEEARALFAGQGDPSVQVWVYASGEDMQRVFDQALMQGGSVTSFARVAVNSQHMSDLISTELNAVGILPRNWMTDDVREVFTIASTPVLAVLQNEPVGVLLEVISCLQG
jgi:hypothetical protein